MTSNEIRKKPLRSEELPPIEGKELKTLFVSLTTELNQEYDHKFKIVTFAHGAVLWIISPRINNNNQLSINIIYQAKSLQQVICRHRTAINNKYLIPPLK